jgi:Fe2+ transport system protein FeoA
MTSTIVPLCSVSKPCLASIHGLITADPALLTRLKALGFLPGTAVTIHRGRYWWLGAIVELRGVRVALRGREARDILVEVIN